MQQAQNKNSIAFIVSIQLFILFINEYKLDMLLI